VIISNNGSPLSPTNQSGQASQSESAYQRSRRVTPKLFAASDPYDQSRHDWRHDWRHDSALTCALHQRRPNRESSEQSIFYVSHKPVPSQLAPQHPRSNESFTPGLLLLYYV